MTEKIILIKIEALNIKLIKEFYSDLKEFCKKYINPFLINEISTTCQGVE